MVKGISRQVIVVRQPDTKLFEQAIFLLRDDALGSGVSDAELLAQAQHAASRYLQSAKPSARRHIWPRLVWMAAGALAACLVWAAILIFCA